MPFQRHARLYMFMIHGNLGVHTVRDISLLVILVGPFNGHFPILPEHALLFWHHILAQLLWNVQLEPPIMTGILRF
eukprot:6023587-Prorocentrum_lima.AAC.1